MSIQPETANQRGVRLNISGLSKHYGTREVLRQAQLSIEPGQFVVIVGRSGCGKSTLLRLVAGLENATAGSIATDGKVQSGLAHNTRIMFQDARLLPWKRVTENVALGLPKAQRAAANAVPWPAPWCTSRACCCSMSRWARWTRSRASRCTV